MKMIAKLGVAGLATLASCGPQPRPQANNADSTLAPTPTAPAAASDGAPAAPAADPVPTPEPSTVPAPAADRTPAGGTTPPPVDRATLSEPKGPIPPKSAEAAGQVVQRYGALIEAGRWSEAARLWGSADNAAAFAAQFRRNRETHLEIGDLGEPEGAAGSIFITMPVSFYGKDAHGEPFRLRRTVTLRRVNDVPGSTEAQRRWHIDRIETQPT